MVHPAFVIVIASYTTTVGGLLSTAIILRNKTARFRKEIKHVGDIAEQDYQDLGFVVSAVGNDLFDEQLEEMRQSAFNQKNHRDSIDEQ